MTIFFAATTLILIGVVVVLVGKNRAKQIMLEEAGVRLMEAAVHTAKVQRQLDGSNRCLEMLLEEQTRELEDAHRCLEMVLEENDRNA